MKIVSENNESPSMFEIEEILSGNSRENEIPETLKPENVHSQYHNLKVSLNPLLTFSMWEREISAQIAHEFFGYNRSDKGELKIPVKFHPSEGWVEDSDGRKKVNESHLKFMKVQNYFMHTSHHWLLESARLGAFDLSLHIEKLKDLGCRPEIADELVQMFPGSDEVKFYNSDNYYVLSQIPNKYKLDKVKRIPKISKKAGNAGKKVKVIVKKQQIIKFDSIIDKLPTIEGINLGLATPDMELLYPFINRTRLILYFWLEQSKPKLSTQMIESMLFHDPKIIKARKWVFMAWFYQMSQLVTGGKQNKVKQGELLNIWSDIFRHSLGENKYKPGKNYFWSNLNSDAGGAQEGIRRMIEKNDPFHQNHPVSRLMKSKLYRKIA